MDEINITTPFYNFQECHNYADCKVEVIDSNINYDDFFKNFLCTNKPCLIKDICANWNCVQTWVTPDNTINHDYFTLTYGDLDAPVANCHLLEYNSHSKMNMKLVDYMSYLKNKSDELLYLKDWHLRRLKPKDKFYEVPRQFASDWLNEYAEDLQEDDFMFVYIGPKESWTPLHADVYNSYSWSVNVVGMKKWVLFPPGEENKMMDNLGNLPMLFDQKKYEDVIYFEINQHQGDAIFVPSGWYHQVQNVLDTISINHNWINACNIEKVWDALQNSLTSVEKEIEELRSSEDFLSQCQIILKSLFGMNFDMFVKFVCHIGLKRLDQLQSDSKKEFGNYLFGNELIKFDLNVVLHITIKIIHHPLFKNADVVSLQMQENLLKLNNALSLHKTDCNT